MKVSVVIPSYNHMDLIHQILFDLYQYCRNDIDEIIIVDDGSDDPDVNDYYVNGMMIKKLPVTVVKKVANTGFLETANIGMRDATGDVLVLISNDVRVKDNFIKKLKDDIFTQNTNIIVGNRLIAFDTGWNKFDRIYPYLEGWLIACTKDVWEELGGFDDQLGHSDYEDIDFSTKAIVSGYHLMSLDNSKIQHIGAQTYGYNPQREARTKENKKKFRAKWIK